MVLNSEDVESIRRYARGALLKAGVVGIVPVPLDQVAQGLKLSEPEDLYALGDAPEGLRQKIEMLKGKVLGALDFRERRVFLDADQPETRRRFHYGHELGHDALPWHQSAYYGDDEFTLDPDTHQRLELEATAFGVEVIFGVDAFGRQADEYRLGLGAPLELAEIWCLSRSTTIRRYVEGSSKPCALLVIGRYRGINRVKVLRVVQSTAFGQRYGEIGPAIGQWLNTADSEMAAAAYKMIGEGSREPVVEGTFRLADGPAWRYELTSNGYGLFALLFEPSRIALGRRVRPAWTSAPTL